MNAWTRPGVVANHEDKNAHGEEWMNKPAENHRRDVEDDANRRAPHFHGKEGWRQMRLYEFWMATQMKKRRQPGRRHQCRYDGVKDHRHLLIHEVAAAECACEYACGKRNQGCSTDYAKIDPVERRINLAETLKHIVMVEPNDPDIDKCNRISHVGRPFRQEFLSQSSGSGGWTMDFQDEQRNDDREGSVTEALHATRLGKIARVVVAGKLVFL